MKTKHSPHFKNIEMGAVFLLMALFNIPGFCDEPKITVDHEPKISADLKGSGIQVVLTKKRHGEHHLEGHFQIEVSSKSIWNVLSDYDNIANFVSSIKKSQKIIIQNDGWVVEQVMIGKVGMFKKHVHLVLEINEVPNEKIIFKDIAKSSFKSYSGSWEIIEKGGLNEVLYKLDITPDFFAPDFLTNGAFKKTVTNLLSQVRAEILKRNRQH